MDEQVRDGSISRQFGGIASQFSAAETHFSQIGWLVDGLRDALKRPAYIRIGYECNASGTATLRKHTSRHARPRGQGGARDEEGRNGLASYRFIIRPLCR
jgi:hypothetical protein